MGKSCYSSLFADRKAFCDNICRFLVNRKGLSVPPIIMSIDAPWGFGKTHFLNALVERVSDSHVVLTYNAWECDFEKDALLSITNELVSQMKGDESSLREVWQKAASACSSFGGTLSKQAIKVFLGFDVDEITDKIKSGYKKNLEEKNKLGVPDISASHILIDKFKDILIEYRKSSLNSKEHKDVIVCIDELDRCEPNYAIELLERIKHFLSVEGYVFIFMTNKEQLLRSVRNVFGEIDPQMYLQRFFDYEFSLPEPSFEEFMEYLYPSSEYSNDISVAVLKEMIQSPICNGCSLRDIDHIASYFNYARSFGTDGFSETQKAFYNFVLPYQALAKFGIANLEILGDDSWICKIDKVEPDDIGKRFMPKVSSLNGITCPKFEIEKVFIPVDWMYATSSEYKMLFYMESQGIGSMPEEEICKLFYNDICLGNCKVDITVNYDSGRNRIYYFKIEGVSELCVVIANRLRWLGN